MTENRNDAAENDEGRIKRFKFALSLARKSGNAMCGTEAVCDGIKSRRTCLVVLSSSASDNSKKRVSDKASYYSIKLLYTNLDTESLGAAVGKTALTCIGITDKNLAFIVERNLY
ncbi:MAG: L7Ae/L30e/S12e/Gadd45 family ribosomal protein [Eubacteriales bacterium]